MNLKDTFDALVMIIMSSDERKKVESILAKSKLKENDVEEIDNLIKRGLFEKYYKTKVNR